MNCIRKKSKLVAVTPAVFRVLWFSFGVPETMDFSTKPMKRQIYGSNSPVLLCLLRKDDYSS